MIVISNKKSGWYRMKETRIVVVLFFVFLHSFSQTDTLLLQHRDTLLAPVTLDDTTLKGVEVIPVVESFSVDEALVIIKNYYNERKNWEDKDDAFIKAVKRLIYYVENEPIDTTIKFLLDYPIQVIDTVTFIQESDSIDYIEPDSLSLMELQSIKTLHVRDSFLLVTDSLPSSKPDTLLKDLSPFEEQRPGKYVFVDDSVKRALDALLQYAQKDSSQIWLHNVAGDSTEIVVKDKSTLIKRFWLKNEVLDSIGIWVEVMDREGVRFHVDDGVYFRKYQRRRYKSQYIIPEYAVDQNLRDVQLRKIEPNPWDLSGIGSITLSQTYLSNWAKGGESTIATIFRGDFNAKYIKGKHKWENMFRMKFGLMKLGAKEIRKNEDFWELNSNYGLKASKKWYYSIGFNLKSQFAKGYKYPNDSVVVSNFFSPGYLYSSLGLEYTPSKKNRFLLSPVTFKSVFIIDTSMVEHTQYGIPQYSKSKRELGAYVKINYTFNFNDDIYLENHFHLFTDYKSLKKIDLDWEANLRVNIGPFFIINFSIHLMYDNDVTFPVYDDSGAEIGRESKLQFKEYLGLGAAYKF